ncbi:MAG: hypothetical protein BWY74_01961 [Firmicutes bacterium ADurb.Bin419]|nr:MAG: hypothetical protein BWY74_01961 [Firmicutes bacterium ADurb.Bin419]
MKGFFELNLEALKKDYSTLARICESFYRENGNKLEQIICEKTKNDLINFKVNIGNHNFFLHSSYDPVKEAKNWVSRLDLKSIDTIAILGVGAGYHLEELFDTYPTKNKVVIEPDIGVFVKLMTVRDIRHLITAKNTLFIVSDNTEHIAKVFLGLREDGQIDSVLFTELLSYRTAYDEWWTSLKKDFIKYSKLHEININTSVVFSKDWIENFFENIIQLIQSVNLDSYESRLKGVPAVIVSAGPSLNKNLHLINKIKDKAVIISAGSSINILEKNGVTPHIMVGVDGGEGESRIFNNVKASDIYFAYSSSIHHEGLKNYKGPKLYFKTNVSEYTSWFEKEMDLNTKDLRSGASVSNLALDIARLMGCDPIILVGQDLSYANLQSYADGAVLKDEQDKILKQNIEKMNKYYLKEKDINGNIVYTIPSMISMKIYFEEYVKLYPKVTYLNGSEGGLPIKGIPNKPLSEIIDQYCQNESEINNILEEIYRKEISVNSDRMDKIKSFLQKVNSQSEEMKDKALKRMDLILDILRNINENNNEKWIEIDELTEDIEKHELFEFFIEPICRYFIQAVKNERERKSEDIDNIEEKKRFLYEGLLMQYTDIKDKIVQINEISRKIINEIN